MNQFRVKKVFLYLKRKVQNFSYRKAFVFLVCLALSSFLWLMSSLEKHYTSRISIPVRYVEFPKDRQLAGQLPSQLDLVVDAYGYTLLSYKLRLAFSPVLLNVSELVDNAFVNGSNYRYTIFTVNHKEEIEKQISSEIRILSIKPDSLVFNLSKVVTKKIRVQPNIKVNLENQFSLRNEPVPVPDSILVSGPINILDTLRFVATRYHEYNKLSRSAIQKQLLQPIPGLRLERDEVDLSIPIEQNTEVSFEVPIQIRNKPPDSVLKTFPAKIKVSCRIGLSKYKNLDYSTFRAFINYEKVSLRESRLPVTLESHSGNVLSVNYAPKEVEYILEREK